MQQTDGLKRENAALRQRLSQLSEASLRINESLDVDSVLQGVLDSARELTNASYGMITLHNAAGQVERFLGSGFTEEETQRIWNAPEPMRVYEYLGAITEPLRVPDVLDHLRSRELPELRVPPEMRAFLAAPVRHLDQNVGFVYLAKREEDGEFSHEDEETLVMFASQSALVIANARRHRDELSTRNNLETLVQTSPVGVVVFDTHDGKVAFSNREAQRIVGDLLKPDGSHERLLESLTIRRSNGRDVSAQEQTLKQALMAAETVHAEEIAIELPDGRSVTALVNATPILSDEGALESFVVTLQDLTALEDVERLRAEFLAMVSHELRTPLSAVKGSVATLLDPATALGSAETLQFLRIIDAQANRMRELISDLLDVAAIETGTLPISHAPVKVATLVDEARSAFLNGGGDHALYVELAPRLPLVQADQLRIVQVLSNLLANAARHSHKTSPIRVSAVLEEVHVAISVTDEGDGVSAEQLPFLFRKFPRVEGNARDHEIQGTGLGLAICKGIVEAHGGRIHAESEGTGHGTRFTFTIPVAEETASSADSDPAPALPAAAAGSTANERLRILVLDDDPKALRYMRDALAREGYEPIVTANPAEALSLLAERKPRLVLLDLMLPGANGMELMEEVLYAGDPPVIFVSAYGQDELVGRALDLGAADYMVKPFSPVELTARIRAALRKRERPQPRQSYVRGDLKIDYSEHTATLAGRPIRLTATEFRMLAELAAHAGRVLTYEQLSRRVWGEERADLRPMRTTVNTLRRRLGEDADNPTYIFTEPRVGYRMAVGEPVATVDQ